MNPRMKRRSCFATLNSTPYQARSWMYSRSLCCRYPSAKTGPFSSCLNQRELVFLLDPSQCLNWWIEPTVHLSFVPFTICYHAISYLFTWPIIFLCSGSMHQLQTDGWQIALYAAFTINWRSVQMRISTSTWNRPLEQAKNSHFLKPTMGVLQKARETRSKDEHDEALVQRASPKRARINIHARLLVPSPSCHLTLSLLGMELCPKRLYPHSPIAVCSSGSRKDEVWNLFTRTTSYCTAPFVCETVFDFSVPFYHLVPTLDVC